MPSKISVSEEKKKLNLNLLLLRMKKEFEDYCSDNALENLKNEFAEKLQNKDLNIVKRFVQLKRRSYHLSNIRKKLEFEFSSVSDEEKKELEKNVVIYDRDYGKLLDFLNLSEQNISEDPNLKASLLELKTYYDFENEEEEEYLDMIFIRFFSDKLLKNDEAILLELEHQLDSYYYSIISDDQIKNYFPVELFIDRCQEEIDCVLRMLTSDLSFNDDDDLKCIENKKKAFLDKLSSYINDKKKKEDETKKKICEIVENSKKEKEEFRIFALEKKNLFGSFLQKLEKPKEIKPEDIFESWPNPDLNQGKLLDNNIDVVFFLSDQKSFQLWNEFLVKYNLNKLFEIYNEENDGIKKKIEKSLELTEHILTEEENDTEKPLFFEKKNEIQNLLHDDFFSLERIIFDTRFLIERLNFIDDNQKKTFFQDLKDNLTLFFRLEEIIEERRFFINTHKNTNVIKFYPSLFLDYGYGTFIEVFEEIETYLFFRSSPFISQKEKKDELLLLLNKQFEDKRIIDVFRPDHFELLENIFSFLSKESWKKEEGKCLFFEKDLLTQNAFLSEFSDLLTKESEKLYFPEVCFDKWAKRELIRRGGLAEREQTGAETISKTTAVFHEKSKEGKNKLFFLLKFIGVITLITIVCFVAWLVFFRKQAKKTHSQLNV